MVSHRTPDASSRSSTSGADEPGERSVERLRILRRMVSWLAPYKARWVLATISLVLGSGLNFVYPQAARIAIDSGMAAANAERLNLLVAGVVVVFAISSVFTWARHYLMSWLGERVVADLRARVFRRMIEQPLSWFHERPSGELTGRLAADVATVQEIVGTQLSMALREVITIIGGLAMLFWQSWQLTLVMLVIVPPFIVVTRVFGRRIRKMSRVLSDRFAETSAHVQETVGGIQTVQAFVREGAEGERYTREVGSFFDESLRLASWRGLFIATISFGGWLATALMLWVGGREIIAGRLTAGDLTAFLLYTTMVAVALGGLSSLWGALQSAAGATTRLFQILDAEPAIRDPDAPKALPEPSPGSIRFEGVSFAYPTRPDIRVLDGVDVEIRPGETVAVVGRSGAGKSTIASMVFRFFDPVAGRVLVDGVDVREVRLHDLRRRLAIVAQEPVLFSGTIAENIAYARPEASVDELERAARLANADAFIRAFPEGYATRIGERGVKLSGGQRQRVAIARALLANPRILILDEATSSLDSESEAAVHEALERLMEGRTTLVIAHRLSTVKDADRIVVLDGGRIADVGSHAELMLRGGLYRSLVERQLVAA